MAVLDGLEHEVEERWGGNVRLFSETAEPRERTVFVTKVDVAVDLDSSGNQAAFIIVTLTDPAEGHETWPVDELLELEEIVQLAVDDIDPSFALPWYTRFVSRTHELDEAEAVELDDQPDTGPAVD